MMSSLLLSLLVLLLVLSLSVNGDDKTCNDAIPLTKAVVGNSKPYSLVASGLRKKNLFVVNVDVYHVGIYASPSLENTIKSNIKANKDFGLSSKTGDDVSLSIYLKFVRAVTTDKIVQAFQEGLSSSVTDKNALNSFTSILLKKIGSKGASKDDTIEFIFKGRNNDEIGIIVRDDNAEIVKSAALRERLIDIYAGKDSIVPELPKQIVNKYK